MKFMINHGMDIGHLGNMVVQTTLQEIQCPTLAFVAFAGPSDIRAGPYNIVPLPHNTCPTIRQPPDMLAGQHMTRQAVISRTCLFRM